MGFSKIFGNSFVLNGYIISLSDVFSVKIYDDLSIVRIIFMDDLIKDFIVSSELLEEIKIYFTNEYNISHSFELIII